MTPYSDIGSLEDYVALTTLLVLAHQIQQPTEVLGSSAITTPAFQQAASVALYVDQSLIDQLANVQNSAWNLGRLVALLGELNANYVAEHPYTCIVLCRAIIDHVPPIFGFTTFNEVLNMPSVARNDRNFLKLLGDNRYVANYALHHLISKKADVIAMHDIPQRMSMNTLVQLVLSAL